MLGETDSRDRWRRQQDCKGEDSIDNVMRHGNDGVSGGPQPTHRVVVKRLEEGSTTPAKRLKVSLHAGQMTSDPLQSDNERTNMESNV